MEAKTSIPQSLLKRQGYQSQNLTDATTVNYWGYAVRVVPCANDPGTCEYFDSVYGGHQRGMIYTGVIWATIGGILLLWTVGRHFWEPRRAEETVLIDPAKRLESGTKQRSGWRKLGSAFKVTVRKYTLPESMRLVFGRTTRLQIITLTLLAGYLAIFTFVGIWYKTWITPVKGYDNLYQKRSWLGSWSDRLGVLAYALTPFSVMLGSRESLLSLLTGIPYQSFNFLHRWLGWIIFVQALVHTIGWTLIEAHFYQPQPHVADKWIKQLYMIWGCVAMIILLLLVVLATPWGLRLTGYEFFRKAHYVLAMVYIGACWGHWQPLKVFMVPGLALWLVDRAARLVRSFFIHYQYLPDGSMGFQTSAAAMTLFPDGLHGDVVRLDYSQSQTPWKPGQHFYLCFTRASIWQSHPFTPLSLPVEQNGKVEHSYIFRAKQGETKKIAQMAASAAGSISTPVVMQGPYGEDHTLHLTPDVNVLCVAGGTGITYVLPTLLWLIRQPPNPDRRITLVWAVRRRQDIEWVRPELEIVAAAKKHNVAISLHVTREGGLEEHLTTASSPQNDEKNVVDDAASSSSRSTGGCSSLDVFNGAHPDLSAVVPGFLDANVRGRTIVFASGPGGMISDLRRDVARANSGAKVWKGDEKADVQLVCDNRLEW